MIRAYLPFPRGAFKEVHDESLGQEYGGRARLEPGRLQPLGQASVVHQVGGHPSVVAVGNGAQVLEDATLGVDNLSSRNPRFMFLFFCFFVPQNAKVMLS